MSFPYPQDRHRNRREKGDQPYKDEREAMSQKDAELQSQAERYGETHQQESEEDRISRMEAEAEERLRSVPDDRSTDD